ncbi:MAG: sulfite exporter TauE/SafE family protein [Candidatus Zixiibacteriota bacterium]
MDTYFWSAIALGFLGSVHCIGMCGPIALALPRSFSSRTGLLVSRVLYNTGRIITYGVLGAIGGLLGKMVALAGFQQSLSIVAGVLILLGVFLPSRFARKLLPMQPVDSAIERIRGFWGRLFGTHTQASLFMIGLLNGLLPCGLVYVALAAAAASGSSAGGALYMLLFGLGTYPAIFATSLFGSVIPTRIRQNLLRLLPVGAVVLALLLILRGSSLGIPYLSPKLHTPTGSTAAHDCCK